MLMTGVASPEDLFAAMDEGADDCLLKPFRWNELIARVRAGLRRVEATRRHAARADELERLNDRHTEFLSMVSHEIRTPLSAILSAANVLMRYGSRRPDSVERFAKVIHQEGRRLTRLINNLLDLAKIEAGHVEWSFAPAAVDELVRDVQESFSALVGERNLSFEVEPWPEPVVVELDRDKVTQVLVNLVSNSIKHSPDGATVRLRYRPLRPGGPSRGRGRGGRNPGGPRRADLRAVRAARNGRPAPRVGARLDDLAPDRGEPRRPDLGGARAHARRAVRRRAAGRERGAGARWFSLTTSTVR